MDLHDALHDLHRDLRGGVTDRPAGPVVAAARRHRTRTRVGYGAVGAGAAAALVVAGLSLDSWRPTPPPPAVTSTTAPAPRPTPTPTPTRAVKPSPTPSWTPTTPPPFQPDLAACGTTVGSDVPQSEDVFVPDMWTSDPGAPLSVPWRVESDGATGDRVTVTATRSYLTQGGPDARGDKELTMVIGVPTAPLPGRAARVLDGGSDDTRAGLDLPLTLPFVMCPGVDGAGGPPPNGDYLVWARVDVETAGSTTSTWGSAYGRVGAWADDPRFYLPEGTTRYDTRAVDFGTCDTLTPARLGLSPEAWVTTDGPLTAQASGRLENGDVVVSLRLTNDAKARPYLEVRYPSVYVVANEPFSGTYNPTFAAGTLMDTGNIGRRPGGTMDAFQGGAPRWTQGTSLGASASLTLETELRPTTCASLYADPWPSISYTVYAFTEVALPDGTVTRVQAAPATFSVP